MLQDLPSEEKISDEESEFVMKLLDASLKFQ